MNTSNENKQILWYKKPATKWTEALPLGNGHMGAMVYGGIVTEKIELTENTCYSGEASEYNNQAGASGYITHIREALFRHDYANADILCEKIIGQKLNYGTNLTFGNLVLNFDNIGSDISDYSRRLELCNAMSFVRYNSNDLQYDRETLISHPHKILAIRIKCSSPGSLDFYAELDGGNNPHTVCIDKNNDLILNGYAYESNHSDGKTGVQLHGRMRIHAENGSVMANNDTLRVKGADSAVILLSIGTDFADADIYSSCKSRIDSASLEAFEDLKHTHIRDHQSFFNRVQLDLCGSIYSDIPTDERLNNVKNGAEDTSLTALMFQYGRYLLMSSSREDSPLPAHLQGIWNDNIASSMSWTCDMHLDINTEMNYWPSEITNLSECAAPLFRWIEERLVPSGRKTAQITYRLDGWTAHVVSNAWGYSAPGWAATWGLHITGGLWVASHMWEHYLFTGNTEFLLNHTYPVYREALKFFLKYLTKDPVSGFYLSGPSMSPENSFIYNWSTSDVTTNSMGTVCDTVLIRELFSSFTSMCEILEINDELLEETKEKLKNLPPFKIGESGQLQEWFYDYNEPDTHHRHTSHLLSVFPFGQITPQATPALAKAAMVSIKKRTTPDWRWEDTGWARALLLLYTARLNEPEEAYKHILAFQRGLTNANLLSFCPPGNSANTDVFEMDGTTGFCTGTAEMLMQSHSQVIHILPALPKEWNRGYIKGLRARGGYEVNIKWTANELSEVEIFSHHGQPCEVQYNQNKVLLQFEKCNKILLDKSLNILKV